MGIYSYGHTFEVEIHHFEFLEVTLMHELDDVIRREIDRWINNEKSFHWKIRNKKLVTQFLEIEKVLLSVTFKYMVKVIRPMNLSMTCAKCPISSNWAINSIEGTICGNNLESQSG